MGVKLITDDKGVTVYRKDKVGKSGNTYSNFFIKHSSKDPNGNWQSVFENLRFKKSDADKVTNKCKIKIKDSFPSLDTYNEKTTKTWMIMDFEVLQEGEKPAEPTNLDDFMEIDDSLDDEVPWK